MEYVTVDGVEVPALGFGTARMDTDDERRRVVATALETGYRHLDTAQMYGSESAVGDAVRESDVEREELFITTKLSGENRSHDAVIDSTHASLDRLDTDYADLLLIHFPNDDVPHEETLDAMNELVEDDVVRNIGVSNFSVPQLDAAIEHSDAPILANQVEYNIHERTDDLLSFCLDEGVLLEAYSPIGAGDVLDDETLVGIATRHDRTPAQVAIRWLLDQPMVVPISMSSKSARIQANSDVFDFTLSDDEMRALFERDGPADESLLSNLGL